MKSLLRTNMDEDINKQIELEKKRELMKKLDWIIWTDEEILTELINTYKDAKAHWSWQALQVRLDTIKYMMKMKGIDVEKESKPIQIAVFNYNNKDNLDY